MKLICKISAIEIIRNLHHRKCVEWVVVLDEHWHEKNTNFWNKKNYGI